jgi:predicted protein tyrosine phosphatase
MGNFLTKIKVSCLRDAAKTALQWKATHTISLIDPCLADAYIPCIRSGQHHVFRSYDQEDPTKTNHIRELVLDSMLAIETALCTIDARILIHCHAGVSRSTAIALGAICLTDRNMTAKLAMQALLNLCEKPWPNRRIVEELDLVLSFQGTLLETLDYYRKQHPNRLKAYRVLNKRRGLVSPVIR